MLSFPTHNNPSDSAYLYRREEKVKNPDDRRLLDEYNARLELGYPIDLWNTGRHSQGKEHYLDGNGDKCACLYDGDLYSIKDTYVFKYHYREGAVRADREIFKVGMSGYLHVNVSGIYVYDHGYDDSGNKNGIKIMRYDFDGNFVSKFQDSGWITDLYLYESKAYYVRTRENEGLSFGASEIRCIDLESLENTLVYKMPVNEGSYVDGYKMIESCGYITRLYASDKYLVFYANYSYNVDLGEGDYAYRFEGKGWMLYHLDNGRLERFGDKNFDGIHTFSGDDVFRIRCAIFENENFRRVIYCGLRKECYKEMEIQPSYDVFAFDMKEGVFWVKVKGVDEEGEPCVYLEPRLIEGDRDKACPYFPIRKLGNLDVNTEFISKEGPFELDFIASDGTGMSEKLDYYRYGEYFDGARHMFIGGMTGRGAELYEYECRRDEYDNEYERDPEELDPTWSMSGNACLLKMVNAAGGVSEYRTYNDGSILYETADPMWYCDKENIVLGNRICVRGSYYDCDMSEGFCSSLEFRYDPRDNVLRPVLSELAVDMDEDDYIMIQDYEKSDPWCDGEYTPIMIMLQGGCVGWQNVNVENA